MSYQPIENYGVIGNLETVALVGMDASIDFLCLPHFDSPSVFAALLDEHQGGHFQIAPVVADEFRRKQIYLPDTNILLTRFLAGEGVAEVSDFMPLEHLGHGSTVVRRVKAVRGEMRIRMVCAPRFDYARAHHTVQRRNGVVQFVSQGSDGVALRLRSTVPLRVEEGAATATFKLTQGETAAFVLETMQEGNDSRTADPNYVSDTFKETMNFWQGWVSRSQYRGRWREMVNRSAMALKLLTSHSYGSIVAAPTFGLPETIGGGRNWDYRYTWVRDASFTLYALLRIGYFDEAGAFIRWIEAQCQKATPAGPLQVMDGIDGRRTLKETVLSHLEGYRKSSPVRIGNAAYHQLQLDIYGEFLDSVYIYDRFAERISYDFWINLVHLVDWVCAHWRLPDKGIWEVRSGRQPFLYSRVLCWVAVDRAIRLAKKHSFPAPLERWQRVRDQIYRDVYEQFWDKRLRTFVQYRKAKVVDAACLLMPLIKIIGPTDPRWASTLHAIEKVLVADSLVYRYSLTEGARDGLIGSEGTFSMCSFWYVECLTRAGDLKQARLVFEKALSYANHLGLYAEQLGPCGEHLGNFPQALSHLALLSAACYLDRRLSRPGDSSSFHSLS